jgi:hypothetical protein
MHHTHTFPPLNPKSSIGTTILDPCFKSFGKGLEVWLKWQSACLAPALSSNPSTTPSQKNEVKIKSFGEGYKCIAPQSYLLMERSS